MKSLMLAAIMGLGSAHAGIGGISGGHVHFQRESTWVNPVYSKTLCFDGEDFHAKIKKCAKYGGRDDNNCERFEVIDAVQPMVSTKKICKRDTDSQCLEWQELPYIQNPNRYFDFYNDDRFVKRTKFKVKSCQ